MASEDAEKEAVRVAVKEILSEEDMDVVTEGMVRKKAAERAGVEVSAPWFKGFVKQLIQEFVSARQDKSKRGEEEEEEEKGDENAGSQESSKAMLAEGEDEIICQARGTLASRISEAKRSFRSASTMRRMGKRYRPAKELALRSISGRLSRKSSRRLDKPSNHCSESRKIAQAFCKVGELVSLTIGDF
ncbi:uncharacterized protein LOC9659063 isoform X1 [Selaginella moellendorffii]|uniref:uncharacterized protein LOC9659063 isoform X1 n=1 Tax=Selaginella moellendorffii TaxID=88036 RepID=UPI000D1D0214|nr:uncharacterized protein LOC9659063 isoform X1 [Selaginella moellendorffii]|eukprot:XP_024525537.1 uncharacterized protein LOC9659063 isoform X1 [Selaginella moellendorffii]